MNDFIKILVVEDNDMSREMVANILMTRGYTVLQAKDGQEALDVIAHNDVHLMLADINMSPMDGLELVRRMLINRIKIPVIVITADPSSDLLSQAVELGVQKVLQKPVMPDRLLKAVERILERQGLNSGAAAFVEQRALAYTPEELMKRAIALAESNARAGKGGPFGAVVADRAGHILGSGVNGAISRVDPMAHAEVMAIRQAAEKLGHSDLSDCVLYCSSEPTLIGQALVTSVGIRDVYYGLSHDEVTIFRDEPGNFTKEQAEYHQLCRNEAAEMIKKVNPA